MKFKNGFFAVMLLIGLVTFNSCGKYEDGPAISLKTKKARIVRTWIPEKFIDSDGKETVASGNEGTTTFTKDDAVTFTSGNLSYSGTWAFSDDKSKLITTFTFGSVSSTDNATILRLTSKELWLKDADGDKVYYKAK